MRDSRGQLGNVWKQQPLFGSCTRGVLHRHWPRGALEGPNENGANRSPGKLSAVYLNGRQPGVKLLDRVRNALRVGQYALETEKAYVDWIKQYIRFHGTKHPEEMGAIEVEQFLTHLAVACGFPAEGYSGGCQEVRFNEAGHTPCLQAQLCDSFAGRGDGWAMLGKASHGLNT
jgi:hypothetical protein